MWIKTKKNFFSIFIILVLSSFFSVACSNSTNTEKLQNNSNQQEVDALFKKAQNLFDQDKNDDAYKISMWISMDEGCFIHVSDDNVDEIIRYLYERFPY